MVGILLAPYVSSGARCGGTLVAICMGPALIVGIVTVIDPDRSQSAAALALDAGESASNRQDSLSGHTSARTLKDLGGMRTILTGTAGPRAQPLRRRRATAHA